MKASELRIGNLVDYEKTTHIITAIDGNNYGRSRWYRQPTNEPDYEHTFDNIESIPLTSELLEKCGFKQISDREWVIGENPVNQDYMMVIRWTKIYNHFYYSNGHFKLLYLHQLQNLYYCLAGEELQIDLYQLNNENI
jgi:hypothetical protein